MMGRQTGDQSQLFYLFNLEERVSASHLLRRINPVVTRVLADLREELEPLYSDIGRPSIDPELMILMLIVGYCYGIRFERGYPKQRSRRAWNECLGSIGQYRGRRQCKERAGGSHAMAGANCSLSARHRFFSIVGNKITMEA
jgi:hypothetical protein